MTASAGVLFLIYLWVRRIYDQRVALVTAAVTAIIPVYFWYSTQVWFESSILFCMLLSLLLYHRYVNKPTKSRFMVLLAGVSLGLLIDWPAYLLIPLLVIDYYIIEKKRNLSFLLIPIAATLIFALTNLLMALAADTVECMPVYHLFLYQSEFTQKVQILDWLKEQWKDDQRWISLPIFITAAVYLVFSLIKRRFKEDRWLYGLFLAGIFYMIIFNRHSAKHEFFLVYLALPFSLAFSLAVCRLCRKDNPFMVKTGSVVLFILMASICIAEDRFNYMQYFKKPSRHFEWKQMKSGKSPTLHRFKDSYFYMVDLTRSDLSRIERILRKGLDGYKPKNLVLAIFNPRFADTEEEKKQQQEIKDLVESRFVFVDENANIMLYILSS